MNGQMRGALNIAAGLSTVIAAFVCGRHWPSTMRCDTNGIVMHGFENDVPIKNGPKGSCWCGEADGYCLCTPSLSIDAALIVCVRGCNIPHIPVVMRLNVPLGEALPGGYVNVGETVEAAASREVKEEIGVHIDSSAFEQVHLYSSPFRDHRRHGAAQFMTAIAHEAKLKAGDDAKSARLRKLDSSLKKEDFAFPDHYDMLMKLLALLDNRTRPICTQDGTATESRVFV